MTPPEDAVRAAAFAALARAYAPYSEYPVGAAIETRDGRIFPGCNVENASSGGAICAERAALVAAVSHGAREFSRLVIATAAAEPAPPCGICRQALVEFAPALRIESCTRSGAFAAWTLAELLPHPFIAHSLGRA